MHQKEIQYSSWTCAETDEFKRIQGLHGSLANILENYLPIYEDAMLLKEASGREVYNIVH